MSGTISTILTSSYTLSVNPTTITATGGVEVAAGDAIFGPSPSAWAVLNEGTVSSTTGYGVLLEAGGTITNAAHALIEGGSSYNSGSQSYLGDGVRINGAAGTIVNSGTIEDQEPARYYGYQGTAIFLGAGGSVSNANGGAIIGGGVGVANYSTAKATVTNAGMIVGNSGDGVFFDGGIGSVTNKAAGTIAGKDWGVYAPGGSVTIANAGTITGLGGVLAESGSITNMAGGVITGGVDFSRNGTVVNIASITDVGEEFGSGGGYYFDGLAVSIAGGGRVTNFSGGVIMGGSSAAEGILAGGTGVVISGGAGTVVNAGTITGGADAVELAAGYANLVVDDPGAVFNGTVDGGNAIGGPIASTLELAAGSPGTLHNLNIQFIDFSHVDVNKNANWRIFGSGSIVAGQTLLDSGTVAYFGNTNIVANSLSGKIALAGGELILEHNLSIAAGGVLTGSGTVTGNLSDSGIDVAPGGTIGGGSGILVFNNLLDSTIAGAIAGNEVEFVGDSGDYGVSLAAGVDVSVHTIAVVGDSLSLASGLGNFAFDGVFKVTEGTFDVGSNSATLAGPASFLDVGAITAEITGTSQLTLAGATHMANVPIEGSELIVNSGILTQSGKVTLDNSASLSNAAGGTWDLTSNFGIALGSGATGSITNAGTFEKTAGSGTSVIAADFVNDGTIIATSGTLDFAGGFSNHGTIIENGGTVIVGPKAGPALFNQYVAGIPPDGAANVVAATEHETSRTPLLAAPHAA